MLTSEMSQVSCSTHSCVSAPQSTKSSRKAENAMVKPSARRFSTRETAITANPFSS